MNWMNYQYESIWQVDRKVITKTKTGKERVKNVKELQVRLFDPKTKKSVFRDVTNLGVPDLWLPDKKGTYKSFIDGTPLKKFSFSSMDDYKKFKKDIQVETGETIRIEWEGDIIEFPEVIWDDDAHGYDNPRHVFLHRYFDEPLKSNHIHRVMNIDIETRSGVNRPGKFPSSNTAYEEVTLIQIYDNFTDMFYILDRRKFTGTFDVENVKHIHIPEEKDLLDFFIRMVEKMNPSIVTGWNTLTFDIPYLTMRIARVLDDYVGDSSDIWTKNGFVMEDPESFKNVKRLSPLGIVTGKEVNTKDGMSGVTAVWTGILHLDYKELSIKYGYLKVSSFSLNNVAKELGLSQKIDHSEYATWDGFYTGEGYVIPMNPDEETKKDAVYQAQVKYKNNEISYEEFRQVIHNRFVEYGLRDVQIVKEIDDSKGYLKLHMDIAYLTSVDGNDNWNVYNQWISYFFKTALEDNVVLPLKSRSNNEVVYLGGWVRSVPGKYTNVSSFDFASLYPSVIRTWNIGADTLIAEEDLPEELIELREKYFNYFTLENINIKEENGSLGKLTIEHDGEINDILEEAEYYDFLLKNKDEISKVLKKYNVGATPNGFFYRNDIESYNARLMRQMFADRYKAKGLEQKIEGEIEAIKADDSIAESEKKQLLDRKTRELSEQHGINTSLKLMLVSNYGSLALSHNQYSNGKQETASITIAGRMSNRMCSIAVNNAMQELLGREKTLDLELIPQVDTDSCVGSTEVDINKKRMTIEVFYDSARGYIEHRGPNNTIKHIPDSETLLTPSLNMKTGIIEHKKVKYIMKHKVKKRMFKIKHKNSEIVVTEDHSCIIKRNGEYIDVKPKDIKYGDKSIILDRIISTLKETEDFIVEDLGIQEEWVYDIEVEDNHNFFGNDICVHNSMYVNVGALFDKNTGIEKLKHLEGKERIEFLLKFSETRLQDAINNRIKDLCELLNTRDGTVLKMENEVITEGFVSVALKRYYTRVIVSDGHFLAKPKLKVTGLDLVGKALPDIMKKKLKPILDIILDKDKDYLIKYINDFRDELAKAEPQEFARKINVSKLNYSWVGGAKGKTSGYKKFDGEKWLTAPIGSWASIEYNKYISTHNLEGKYPPAEPGESISYIYVNEPNEQHIKKAIGWKDPRFTHDAELFEIADRETHFAKDFINKIKIITDKIGWNIESRTTELEDW